MHMPCHRHNTLYLTGEFHVSRFRRVQRSDIYGHTVTTAADGPGAVYPRDIDGDGDVDIVSGSEGDNKVAWHENNGSESFTEHVIVTTNDSQSVYAIDVDGDNDIDVLSAGRTDNEIAWYENDGSQSFAERIISTGAVSARSIFAIDVDGDGDMDVLSASATDNKIAWYENDGSESFTARTITTGALSARVLSMHWISMEMGILMSSAHRQQMTRSLGTRTTEANRSRLIQLPRLRIAHYRCLR